MERGEKKTITKSHKNFLRVQEVHPSSAFPWRNTYVVVHNSVNQLCYFRDCLLSAMSLKSHLYGFLRYAILSAKQNFKSQLLMFGI